MRFKGGFCLVIVFAFCMSMSFVLGELNLVVSAHLNNTETDLFIQTNEGASLGFDVYDLEYPPFPVSSPRFFSVIEDGDRELIMDSWKSENRKLKLVYSRRSEDSGRLVLKFGGDVAGSFRMTIHDFGGDASFTDELGAHLITANSVYDVVSNEDERYFLLDVDYLFCGDGVCSEDESCSVCSVDCSGCSGVGASDPYHFLSVLQIGEGYGSDFSFGEGFTFNFKDEVYSVSVVSIVTESVSVLLSSDSETFTIAWGGEEEVDIDSDSVIDFVLRADSVNSRVVYLYFQGRDVLSFSDVSVDDRVTVPGRVSVFDRVYGKDKPIWLRILVTVGLLVIGISLLVFAFFLLRNKRRGAVVSSAPVVAPINSIS